MTNDNRSQADLSAKELRILRTQAEWAAGYAMTSAVIGFMSLGGAFAIFEYLGIDDRTRIPSFVLFATLIVVNVVWRAVGARAGRVESIVRARSVGGSGSKGGDQGRL